MQIQVPAATNVMMSTSWIDPHHLIHPCPRHKKVGCFFLYISIFSYGISLKLAYSINNLDSFFSSDPQMCQISLKHLLLQKGVLGFSKERGDIFLFSIQSSLACWKLWKHKDSEQFGFSFHHSKAKFVLMW